MNGAGDRLGFRPGSPAVPAERPRVLHVVDSLAVGGMERGLLRVIGDTRSRFDHCVACVRDTGGREGIFAAAGARVYLIGKRRGQDLRVPWRIAHLCRELRPHIVHTRNWGAIDGVVAGRLARVPFVVHGEHGRDTRHRSATERRRDRARRLLFPFVDRVVIVSQHLERWLRDDIRVRPERVLRISNGVDTAWFRPDEDREQARRERGYGPEHFLVGAVGRLQRVKNHADLLAAFEPVARERAAARLVVVGDGPERDALRREIERRGLQRVVRLAGEHEDVRPWLASMDVFALPSLMEGTCNALLEAMSAGLPVVATRVGGNPEVVVDGVTGRLVEAGDVAALSAALRAYGDSPAARAAHRRAGRQRVVEHYSAERMVNAYADLYGAARPRPGAARLRSVAAAARG